MCYSLAVNGRVRILPEAGQLLVSTITSFEEIIQGKHDEVPEQCFYMKGGIDEVVAHHKRLLEEEAKKAS